MDENDMSIANQSMPRDRPVLRMKLLSQPALSPSRSKTVPATSATEMKSPLSKSKPKQLYLKRGTGLQARLAAAKQKRYVPKGGFIKGQAEDEAVQQPHAPASSLSHDSVGLQQAGKHSVPAVWPQLAHPSSEHAEEPSPLAHSQHDQAGMAHRQLQGNSQLYTYAADQEAEMDADTALVHFPGTAQQSRQEHGDGQQPFEPYISAPQHTAAPHVLKQGGRSLQQQADCSMHNDPLQAAYMQSSAGNGAAPVDWQLQQAAEALELEEFRALERQITQDSGMSVRGSVASLSAVTGMHNPIAGLQADTHRQIQSEHRMPLAPMSQPGTQSMGQARDQHQVPWQYPASQAAESSSSLHEAQQAHSFQAPRQLPPSRVTGNPFAEPDNFDRPATSLLSYQHESNEQGWDAQAPSYARHTSRAQSVDQPQVDLYAEAQQAIPDSDFKHESAWDAAQVAQGPGHSSDETSQDVRSGLQSTRASQSYIQGLFRQQQPVKPACETKEDPNDTQAASIAALEQEMKEMQSERAKVSKLRIQLEQASTRMEQEKAAWERQKAEEAASWEYEKEADSQRLKRHQRVLDKQSRALLKLPNRKERSEVEAVEAILEQERKAGHAKDARHKLTVERLRQKLVELQDTNAELREEIRFHEQRRLEEWNAKETQQPKADSKGRAAGGALSGAATSTNRSKPALSPQEASSKPGHLQAAAAAARRSSQPAFVESITAVHEKAAQTSTASLADDVSEADYVKVGEVATEQLAGPATANGMHWRVQRHGMSGHAYLASQRADQQPQHSLENSAQAAYGPSSHGLEGTPRHNTQPMDAFQPIASVRCSDAASWGLSMAAQPQQQGSQANHVIKADRYQHATVLDSPDEFTWQPIRPPHNGHESRLEAPQSHLTPSAQADTWGQNHMASSQQGYRQGDSNSRSLRQSLDAAARLDARLQGAQQQQQQHADASHQQAGQQHHYTAAVNAGLGSSSLWQDLQEAHAATQPQAQSQTAGLQNQNQNQQQQQQWYQEQQALVGEGGQAQKASRGSIYDGPILMDRSRPQTAADVPAATFAVGQALTQSAQAQGLLGSWASHSAVAYSGDRGPSSQVPHDDTCGAHDQQWARATSMTAAQEGIAQSMQEHQQRSAGDEHLSSAGGAPDKPYQELSYPDGKVEQIFLDGRRTVVFGNGTRKHQFPDGHTAIRFTNKDIKRFYPCGRVEYYYCEVDTWHTTHANGIEVFYFPNGQTEAHHPSGTKEIIFPDGVIRRVFTDGREQDVTPEQLSGPVKYPMPEDRD